MKTSHKWIHGAIPALLLHCSIGTVYCWGTFSSEIAQYVGSDKATMSWAFSIAILFLGLSAAFCGNMVEKNIHRSSLIAAICFSLGMAGTGLFIMLKSVVGIFLCYGVLMGIGLGIGYLSPVKTLMLWFSDHKGLATGLSVAGFGAAKAIATPIMQALIGIGRNKDGSVGKGIYLMFFILAGAYFVMMLIGHLLLKKPEGWHESTEKTTVKEFFARFKIFGNPTFIGIWLVFFINISCGLALIHDEKHIFSLAFGKPVTEIIGIVTVLGVVSAIFNALGRLGFSTAGDFLKDRNTIYKVILIMSIVVSVVCLVTGAVTAPITALVIALVLLVNAGYGGGFSNLPTLLSDRFGMKAISSIHGIALSAWGFAGIFGPQAAEMIMKASGDAESAGAFKNVLIFTSVLYAIALVINFILIRKPKEKAE